LRGHFRTAYIRHKAGQLPQSSLGCIQQAIREREKEVEAVDGGFSFDKSDLASQKFDFLLGKKLVNSIS
jgi:hypothetical protein